MSLLKDLQSWDGKSVNTIEKIASNYEQDSSLINELLPILEKEALQKGATWILKHYLESGGMLN